MEARLYAENPQTGFLPSTGPLTHFRLPDGIRVDSAVEQGGEVTAFYDPMIAKLIVHAPTRAAAAAALAKACRAVEIWPVKANAGFLSRCLDAPDFVAGAVDTGFIERRLEALVAPPPPSGAIVASAASALFHRHDEADVWSSAQPLAGFRLNRTDAAQVRLTLGGQILECAAPRGAAPFRGLDLGEAVVMFEAGEALVFSEPRADGEALDALAGDGMIRSPMPGKIVHMAVAAGDAVAKGQALLTVEAMKMEHVLAAPFDGVVAELHAAAGDQVTEGLILVRLTADA
jgi:acetyl/propionyl-CoA carboxylase alpha subunit